MTCIFIYILRKLAFSRCICIKSLRYDKNYDILRYAMCYAEMAIIEIYVHDDEVRHNLCITLGTKISYLFMLFNVMKKI